MSKKKILTGLLDLLDIKASEEAIKQAEKGKIDKVNAERLADAVESELDINPSFLDDLEDEEYFTLMENLPNRQRSLLMGDDMGVQMADETSEMVMQLDPEDAAKNMELFSGGLQVADYLSGLDAKGLKTFKENISPDDTALFNNALERLEELGPRKMKGSGGYSKDGYMGGGQVSMLVPPERIKRSRGGKIAQMVVDFLRKDVKKGKEPTRDQLDKAVTKTKETYPNLVKKYTEEDKSELKTLRSLENYAAGGGGKTNIESVLTSVIKPATEVQDVTKPLVRKQKTYRSDMAKNTAATAAFTTLIMKGPEVVKNTYNSLTETEREKFEKAFSKAHNNGQETFMYKGKEYTTEVRKGTERDKYSKGQLVKQVWKAFGKEATPEEIEKAEELIKKPAKNKNYSDRAYVTRGDFEFGKKPTKDVILKTEYPEGSKEFQNAFLQAWRRKAKVFTYNGNQYKVDEASPEIKNKKEISKGDIRDQYKQELLNRINKLEFIDSTDPEGMQKEDFRREFQKHLSGRGHQDILVKSGNYEGTTPDEIGEDSLDAIDEFVAALVEGNNKEQFLTDKDASILYAPLKAERQGKEHGGVALMAMPVDTYDNIPDNEKEAAEKSQLPDDEMETKYIEFIIDEALQENDQDYLMEILEQDDRLSDIFDQVMGVASEFSGEGEVKGPGTGVSDSIPARLSDGEFVFTKKATDQIGADKLQEMMDNAERDFDNNSRKKKAFGGLTYDPATGKRAEELTEDELTEEAIKQQMIGSNRMPSLR